MGKLQEAEAYFQQALQIYTQIMGPESAHAVYQYLSNIRCPL